MFCDNAVEPLNPTPVFDIVTPVPWFNIKEFSTDMANISFVCSPNSDAFDDKSTFLPLSSSTGCYCWTFFIFPLTKPPTLRLRAPHTSEGLGGFLHSHY
mgnify:CR=1 FL=1